MTGIIIKWHIQEKCTNVIPFLPLNESQVLLLVSPIIKYFFRSTVNQMSVDRQVIFIYIFSLFQNVGLFWLLLDLLNFKRVVRRNSASPSFFCVN